MSGLKCAQYIDIDYQVGVKEHSQNRLAPLIPFSRASCNDLGVRWLVIFGKTHGKTHLISTSAPFLVDLFVCNFEIN